MNKDSFIIDVKKGYQARYLSYFEGLLEVKKDAEQLDNSNKFIELLNKIKQCYRSKT
jgi:hypothetical protein